MRLKNRQHCKFLSAVYGEITSVQPLQHDSARRDEEEMASLLGMWQNPPEHLVSEARCISGVLHTSIKNAS
jgi:hypothetical protein